MKNQLAKAMALALVVGVVGLAAAPLAAATHQNCDESFVLDYNERSDQKTLDSTNTIEIAEVDVPLVDPDTLELIEVANLDIDVTSGSGDVEWAVFQETGGCEPVVSGSSASQSPDAELDPDETYWIKTVRATGTTSVSFDMLVATAS